MALSNRTNKKTLSIFPRIFIVTGLLIGIGMSFWLMWIDQHRIVPIVMYHHIDEMHTHDVATIPPERFEKHLQYLKEHDYKVLSLDELVEAIKFKKPLSRKTVTLTFDDGYLDNFKHAYPLLKKYGYPATMYISSDLVGQPGYMDWNQLKEMQQSGITIGSHTRHHKYLPEAVRPELVDEIVNSRKILEQQLGTSIDHFSYPVGGFNRDIKQLVKNAGYKSAVSTNRGYDRYNQDIFELNRVTIDETDNFGAIRWAKFSGYYNLFRTPKNPE